MKVANAKKSSILNRVKLADFQSSTKIEALREELALMLERDPSAKALVFSQFTSMLDLIYYRLQQVCLIYILPSAIYGPILNRQSLEISLHHIGLTGFQAPHRTDLSDICCIEGRSSCCLQLQCTATEGRLHWMQCKLELSILNVCSHALVHSVRDWRAA